MTSAVVLISYKCVFSHHVPVFTLEGRQDILKILSLYHSHQIHGCYLQKTLSVKLVKCGLDQLICVGQPVSGLS